MWTHSLFCAYCLEWVLLLMLCCFETTCKLLKVRLWLIINFCVIQNPLPKVIKNCTNAWNHYLLQSFLWTSFTLPFYHSRFRVGKIWDYPCIRSYTVWSTFVVLFQSHTIQFWLFFLRLYDCTVHTGSFDRILALTENIVQSLFYKAAYLKIKVCTNWWEIHFKKSSTLLIEVLLIISCQKNSEKIVKNWSFSLVNQY